MYKIVMASLALISANFVIAQDANEPEIFLSCRGITFRHLSDGVRNIGDREHLIYMNPSKNQLALVVGGFQWVGTEELETSPNSYRYLESNYEHFAERNRLEIDRTTLRFTAGYRDAGTFFYSVEGHCVVVNPQI